MDLLSESSGTAATRILSARHISLEKSTPELNTETNTTLLCNSFSVQPPFRTYLEALHPYEWVVFPTGAVLLIVLALLYAVTLKSALKHYKHGIFNIAVIVSVYPIVALCSFLVVLLPRVRVLLEAVAQESVMVSMYFFYRFIISECGGKDQMVRRSGGASLETRVLPCCCWPCCVLPRPQLKTKHVSWIGHLVLQLPIVQGIIYTVILIIWAEDFNLYVAAFPYIQPFIAASILTGVWGTIMCVRAANSAAGLQLKPKYLVLQLALLIVKLQCASIKAIPSLFTIPCVLKMHPLVFVSLILNCIIIIEMLLLSLWAYNLYKKPTGKGVDPVQQVVVAVLDESFNMDSKPRKESNGSKSS